MGVDHNEKIWNYSSTGTKAHAFVQVWKDKDGNESPEWLRALCRGTIARHSNSAFFGQDHAISICTRCEKLANAMWDRAEASMEPADPYSDGFHTVDETTATATVQGQRVETLADVQRLVVDEVRRANQLPDEAKRKFVGRKPLDIDALHAEALAEDETRWETENDLYNRYDRIGVPRPGVADALTIAHREAMATLPRPQRTEAQRNATRDTLRRAINLNW